MASKTLFTLLATTAFFAISTAQAQCPAGITNVQTNSNGVLYAIIPHLLSNGEAPNKELASSPGASAIDCSAQCDKVSGCVFATFGSDPYLDPPQPPTCTFYSQTYTYAFTVDPALVPNPFPDDVFQGAVACAYLAASPSAYPPIDAKASFFESQALAQLSSSLAAGLTTLTTAPPTTTPPSTASSSGSAVTTGKATTGGTTATTSSKTSGATGAYTGPKSNEASSSMGMMEMLVGIVSTLLAFVL